MINENEYEKESILKHYSDRVLKSIKDYPENLIYDVFIKNQLNYDYNKYKFKDYNINQLEEYCESVISDFKYKCGWTNLEERVDKWLNTLSAYEVTLIYLRYNNRFNLHNYLRKYDKNHSIYANTYRDIALNSNISVERIRQLIAKALRKLRHPSRLKYFKNSVEDIHKNEIKTYTDAARAQSRKEYRNKTMDMLNVFYKSFSGYFKDENNVIDENFERFFQANYNALVEEDFDLNSSVMMKIEDMGLSVRSYNCLKCSGCKTVLDLIEMSFVDFTHIRNLGWKSINEIIDKVHSLGLKFDDIEIDRMCK